MAASGIHRTIDAVWRMESPRLIAGLARIVRDVGTAEELAQDALVAALEQWPQSGIPDNPGAWLMATAKHRAIDLVAGMKIDKNRMLANLELTHGALFSQRVLLALIEAGSSRDDAYRTVQELAQRAWDDGIPLRDLLAADERAAGLDLDAIFSFGYYIRHGEKIIARLAEIA